MNTVTVELENLKFKAFHGVYKKEQSIGSFFYVNAQLVYTSSLIKTIEDTVNYEDVFNIIKVEMADTKLLLEEVCQEIISKSKKAFPFITMMDVSIKKVGPPISQFNGGGVKVNFSKTWKQ